MYKLLFLFLLLSVNVFCQSIKVSLNRLTNIDGEGISLVILSSESKENLILPKISNKETSFKSKYLNLFYSWDTEADQNIAVVVYQLENEDLLYVDKNNDNDLTNDGDPISFPLNNDTLIFDVVSEKDKNQILKLALMRKPDIADSLVNYYIDSEGNISSEFIRHAKLYSEDFNFNGEARSFYFDYRFTLRRGELKIGKSSYAVGLFDYSNNGCFNDERDLIIIDLDQSGKLNYGNTSNVFSIHDVFSIEGQNYKLIEVDKYGKYFIIEHTSEEQTYNYLRWVQGESSKGQKKGKLNQEFWDNKLVSLNGEKVNLSDYKGKFLFMNIWGDWCFPCLNEIQELTQAYKKYNNEVAFLGVMKVNNLDQAKRIIEEKEVGWENTFISDEIKNEFDIKGYPTNILIYPDGMNYLKVSTVNRTFFDIYLQ